MISQSWAVLLKIIPGDDLLSHTLARAVPLALGGLTAVFGMGTGVSPPLQSPENLKTVKNELRLKEQPNRVGSDGIRRRGEWNHWSSRTTD
jgi:hypothetical protein